MLHSSSSRIHVMTDNWSATNQCLHPQSVAEINHHSVLSEDKILLKANDVNVTVLCQ